MSPLRFLVVAMALPTVVQAADEAATMDLCRHAAIRAADAQGVPREVMAAITLVETRTRRGGASGPWPWTVNVAGKGNWFASRAAALLHAQSALAQGATSFDVGCFQLNYRWHGAHFSSIDEMFEPGTSAAYAARFLKSLHAESGDWLVASGLYHSRTARHAKRYRELVARAIDRIRGATPAHLPVLAAVSPAPRSRRRGIVPLIAPRPGKTETAPPRSAGGVALVVLRRSGGGLLNRSRTGSDG